MSKVIQNSQDLWITRNTNNIYITLCYFILSKLCFMISLTQYDIR